MVSLPGDQARPPASLAPESAVSAAGTSSSSSFNVSRWFRRSPSASDPTLAPAVETPTPPAVAADVTEPSAPQKRHHRHRPEDDDIPRTSSTSSIPRSLPSSSSLQLLRTLQRRHQEQLSEQQANLRTSAAIDQDDDDDILDDDEDDEDADRQGLLMTSESKQLRYLLCGAVAGAVSRTFTAPLDRLKVLLQTQTRAQTLMAAQSNTTSLQSLAQGVVCIYRDGGLRSFWRGNGMNCVKIVPESAIKFYVFERSKLAIARFRGCNDTDSIGVSGRFMAGGFGGLVSQFAIYPIETLKTRIMTATQSRAQLPPHLQSMSGTRILLHMTRDMWRQGGYRPFFFGLGPSLCGIVPYAGIDLGMYESLKALYGNMSEPLHVEDDGTVVPRSPSVTWLLIFGTISGSVGATAVYPISLVRTRLQAQGTPGLPERYTGALDVIRKTYARESVRGFYKGLVPTLIKVIPAASISYVCYEGMKSVVGIN